MDILLYLVSLKFSRMAAWVGGKVARWLENPILMKTQSSAWTWTFDFDLGFVKTVKSSNLEPIIIKVLNIQAIVFKNQRLQKVKSSILF